MGDALKKVQSGDRLKIPAATFNAMIDAARDHQQRQQGREQTSLPAFRQSGIVLVRNDSGADRDRFDVLGIDSVVISPDDNLDAFKNRVALAGVTPSVGQHSGRFVVLLGPAAAGAIVTGCVSGVCVAKVKVRDEADEYADVTDGQSYLTSGPRGSAQILYKEDTGSLPRWALVRMGVPATRTWRARITWGGWHSLDPMPVESGKPAGHWLEEIPMDVMPLRGDNPVPSRTRDAGGNYIATAGRNLATTAWGAPNAVPDYAKVWLPLPIDTIVEVQDVRDYLGNTQHVFTHPAYPAQAQIVDVSAAASTNGVTCRWAGNWAVPGHTFGVLLSTKLLAIEQGFRQPHPNPRVDQYIWIYRDSDQDGCRELLPRVLVPPATFDYGADPQVYTDPDYGSGRGILFSQP